MKTPAQMRKNLFPLMMKLEEQRVVVVGGGTIAERKVQSLLECGAAITIVSPRLKGSLNQLAAEGHLIHHARTYQPGDLTGAVLAIVAINNKEAGKTIAEDAKRANIPVNVVDRPELCTFIVPAVLRRGHLTMAVSTGGASPAWARHIKRHLGAEYGEEFTRLFDTLASLRQALMHEIDDPALRREILLKLTDDSILELTRSLPADELEPALRKLISEWTRGESAAEDTDGRA